MKLFDKELEIWSQSFCSVQLPSKQFFKLPYGHYVIARYTGKNGHEQKKSMTNCCMKMLGSKPGLTHRNLVSRMKTGSQWPFPTLLDAVSAFEVLSHKQFVTQQHCTANTAGTLTSLIITALIHYPVRIFTFIHRDQKH